MENQNTKPCNPCRHITEGIHCPNREKNGCAHRSEQTETIDELPAPCKTCSDLEFVSDPIPCAKAGDCVTLLQWQKDQAAAPAKELQYYYPTEADKIQSEESGMCPMHPALTELGLNAEAFGFLARFLFESFDCPSGIERESISNIKFYVKHFAEAGLLKFEESGKCIGFVIFESDDPEDEIIKTIRQRLGR